MKTKNSYSPGELVKPKILLDWVPGYTDSRVAKFGFSNVSSDIDLNYKTTGLLIIGEHRTGQDAIYYRILWGEEIIWIRSIYLQKN